MRLTMPILALVVALILVASQAIYTVSQTQYAIKFQLGEIVDVNKDAGLYFKVPLVQNVRYFDRRNLMLENTDVDRVVTSEKTPLEVDFVVLWRITDVRTYYVAVQGNEDLARARLSQTVRSNLAEEFNKSTMHEAISSRPRAHHVRDAAEGRPGRTQHRRRGGRRAPAARRVAAAT